MLTSRSLQSRRNRPSPGSKGITKLDTQSSFADENVAADGYGSCSTPTNAAGKGRAPSPASSQRSSSSTWDAQWDGEFHAPKELRSPFSIVNPRNGRRRNSPANATLGSDHQQERSLKTRNKLTPKSPLGSEASEDLFLNESDWALVSADRRNADALADQLARFEETIVNKGNYAIQTLGRVAASFAESLDTAIEQLVGSLTVADGSPTSAAKSAKKDKVIDEYCSEEDGSQPSTSPAGSVDSSSMYSEPQVRSSSRRASAPAEPAASSQAGSQQELQKLRKVQREYVKLRDRYNKLQGDLRCTESKYADVCSENERLKQQLMVLPDGDPLFDQVHLQLQALLAEKARLASENEQLSHANRGLQELLEYSMSQQMAALEYHADDCAGSPYYEGFDTQLPGSRLDVDELSSCRGVLAFDDKIED